MTGYRSGFVAGDPSLIGALQRLRPAVGVTPQEFVQRASIAAWGDETHVRDNRAQYRSKFDAVLPLLEQVLDARRPDASFYVWAAVPGGDDEAFARELFAAQHVSVLPGRYLARDAHGCNPGSGYVRIALVPPIDDCVDGARRIVEFCNRRTSKPAATNHG
jgi:N-succinyldiaminopimelate aminotransferase